MPRVPAYTFFAPRRSASSRSARPMPRFAPVIKTVLFVMFMTVLLLNRSWAVLNQCNFKDEKTKAEIQRSLMRLLPEPYSLAARFRKAASPASDTSTHFGSGEASTP